ncbi:alpha/beta fold hydrolase [Aquimarina hainanensis]|uniref:Alpha/beta fold hydrolase n=1 Tax=Aquimarina hainanensis TaxID=1578017 RepID=A0ABW5N0S2_9FLAO
MDLTYKGVKINYDTRGEGEAIVFLHGFLENSSMWNQITPHFINKYQCITIDLLGHGASGCIGYIHTMEEMAKSLKAVLDVINVEKVTLIGHSMGGYVALAFIEEFPLYTDRIVLLNSTSFPDSKERKINRERAIQIVKNNPQAYTSMAIANLFAKENRARLYQEIIKIKEAASQTPLQGIISALEGMKIRKDRTHILSSFEGEKIMLAGKKDPVLSFEQAIEESNRCKVDLIGFSGGHMTYLENQSKFLESMQQFLKM